MMTLALEYLAESEKQITFTHAFPGLVGTDIFSRLTAPESFGILGRLYVGFIGRFFSILQYLFGMSATDCGARQAYLLTSDEYGPGQVWRINDKSEPIIAPRFLEQYREHGWQEKVWEYTAGVFGRILAPGS